jgi:hypothetical protein
MIVRAATPCSLDAIRAVPKQWAVFRSFQRLKPLNLEDAKE